MIDLVLKFKSSRKREAKKSSTVNKAPKSFQEINGIRRWTQLTPKNSILDGVCDLFILFFLLCFRLKFVSSSRKWNIIYFFLFGTHILRCLRQLFFIYKFFRFLAWMYMWLLHFSWFIHSLSLWFFIKIPWDVFYASAFFLPL